MCFVLHTMFSQESGKHIGIQFSSYRTSNSCDVRHRFSKVSNTNTIDTIDSILGCSSVHIEQVTNVTLDIVSVK